KPRIKRDELSGYEWTYLGGLLLLHRRPGEFRIVQQHHPVDIGGEVGELLRPLPQRRLEERRQNSGERSEGGGVHAAWRFAHQKGLVAKLHRQRKQRAHGEIDVLFGSVAAEAAEQVILGDAELGVLAEFFAQVHRRAVEEMRGSLGK